MVRRTNKRAQKRPMLIRSFLMFTHMLTKRVIMVSRNDLILVTMRYEFGKGWFGLYLTKLYTIALEIGLFLGLFN